MQLCWFLVSMGPLFPLRWSCHQHMLQQLKKLITYFVRPPVFLLVEKSLLSGSSQ